MWVDLDQGYWPEVGDRVYLAEVSPLGMARYRECSVKPYRTNLSREVRHDGWLGSTNNVSRYALGCGVVTKVAKNGRVLVRMVTL